MPKPKPRQFLARKDSQYRLEVFEDLKAAREELRTVQVRIDRLHGILMGLNGAQGELSETD